MKISLSLTMTWLIFSLMNNPAFAQSSRYSKLFGNEEAAEFLADPKAGIQEIVNDLNTELDGTLNEYENKLDGKLDDYETKLDVQLSNYEGKFDRLLSRIENQVDSNVSKMEGKVDEGVGKLDGHAKDVKGAILETIGTVVWRFTLTEILLSLLATFATAFFTAFLTARKLAVGDIKKQMNEMLEESRKTMAEVNATVVEMKDLSKTS